MSKRLHFNDSSDAGIGLTWIFDPAPPSGAREGGVGWAHALPPMLDVFVREVLQNSHDRIKGSGPVRVKFRLHQLDGPYRKRFLNALDWESLESHLVASSMGDSPLALRMRQGLQDLTNVSLRLLQITDSGAEGLTGEEDEPTANFNALCRHVLYTSEDRPQRGGSYGLGKAVLWRFSSFSTVPFSSRMDGNPRAGFQLFGRAELPYHETGRNAWRRPGWFGKSETRPDGKRAVSVWDEEAENTARHLLLFRPAQEDTGTSILVVGFQEPTQEETRPLEIIADDILEAATRWFWPSMSRDSLEIDAQVYENDTRVYQKSAKPGEVIRPFLYASEAKQAESQAYETGTVAERSISFTVPGRQATEESPGAPEVEAQMVLRITRGETIAKASVLANTIVLVRGAGMVVRYWKPVRGPLDNGLPFYGVLHAGLFAGNSQPNEALEAFLRAAEPETHDDWIATERVKVRYRRRENSSGGVMEGSQ